MNLFELYKKHNRKKSPRFFNTLIPFIINHEYIEIRSQKGVEIIIKIVESNFTNKINFLIIYCNKYLFN